MMTVFFQPPTDLELLGSWLDDYRRRPWPKTRSRGVNSMLECIHEHAFDPEFDVTALRRLCRIGDNNRSSRFRQLVGLTPRAYIEQIRIVAAAELLRRNPEASVLDVAYLVGYEHPQTFYRAFRRRFGMPPGAIRSSEAREQSTTCDAPGGDSSDPLGEHPRGFDRFSVSVARLRPSGIGEPT